MVRNTLHRETNVNVLIGNYSKNGHKKKWFLSHMLKLYNHTVDTVAQLRRDLLVNCSEFAGKISSEACNVIGRNGKWCRSF